MLSNWLKKKTCVYTITTHINTNSMSHLIYMSQFSGCWLILSVYILMSFDFPFVRLLLHVPLFTRYHLHKINLKYYSLTIIDLVGGPNWFGIIITNWCCSVQMVWVHESRTALMKHILIGCLVESDFNPLPLLYHHGLT